MRSVKRPHWLIALVLMMVLVAGACGSKKATNSGAGATTTTAGETATKGGDLVFAAEQEGDCLDWIGACAGASWASYTVGALTMPRSFDFNLNAKGEGVYTPSPLLAGEPKLETTPKQKVTYKINTKAVWSDGQPITSEDYKYTWDQIKNGTDIYDKTGYSAIESVDTPDPKTAVVTYSEPYAGWRDLFGAYYGVLPSHLLAGKDRDAEMKDGYTWSGGPWILDHWTKGVETKLVPNPKYWGKVPNVDSMTFKLIQDTAAEQQAVKSGQVMGSYPQAQPGQEALRGQAGLKFDSITSLSYEVLWFNTSVFPLDSKAVRQALASSVDRDAIVAQLFKPVQDDIKRIDSFSTPAYPTYTQPFSKYAPVSLDKVKTLMEGDGWTKGADGIWAKGGKKATLEIKTTQGNKRRELTVQIVQNNWKAAGFETTLTFEKSSVLFGQDGPQGNFQVALYAQVPASTDPGQCSLWCSKNIPSAANGNSGTNWYRINDAKLDDLWTKVDTELDVAKRKQLTADANVQLADIVPAIPVDPFPDIVIMSDKIGGPVGHNPSFGPWYNANEWFLKK